MCTVVNVLLLDCSTPSPQHSSSVVIDFRQTKPLLFTLLQTTTFPFLLLDQRHSIFADVNMTHEIVPSDSLNGRLLEPSELGTKE